MAAAVSSGCRPLRVSWSALCARIERRFMLRLGRASVESPGEGRKAGDVRGGVVAVVIREPCQRYKADALNGTPGAAQAAGSPVQWQGVMHIDRWANAGANMGRSGVLVSFDMKPAHFRETSHPRDGLWHRYLLQRQHQDHHPRGYAKGKCARGWLNLRSGSGQRPRHRKRGGRGVPAGARGRLAAQRDHLSDQ